MLLNIQELSDLEEDILRELPNQLTGVLTNLNRTGRLEELLELLNLSDLIETQEEVLSYREGKIVVIGGSEAKEEVLLSIAKQYGIEKDRFEFCLDYKKAQKFDFRKMQYAPQYRIIMCGPIPHSTHDKGASGSIIAELEKRNSGYPRVHRLMSGNELKITKTSFRDAISQLVQEAYI